MEDKTATEQAIGRMTGNSPEETIRVGNFAKDVINIDKLEDPSDVVTEDYLLLTIPEAVVLLNKLCQVLAKVDAKTQTFLEDVKL